MFSLLAVAALGQSFANIDSQCNEVTSLAKWWCAVKPNEGTDFRSIADGWGITNTGTNNLAFFLPIGSVQEWNAVQNAATNSVDDLVLCNDGCTAGQINDFQCSGNNEQQCQFDAQTGCIDWQTTTSCSDACDGNTGQCCANECTPNAFQCNGNTSQQCLTTGDSDPCYEWTDVSACGTAIQCNVATGQCRSCTDECLPGSFPTCSGDTQTNCVFNAGDSCYDQQAVACGGLGCDGDVCDSCGNSVTEGAEQCDDGNLDNTDACTNICQLASCNDGFTQPSNSEQCDAGVNNGVACTPAPYNHGDNATVNQCTYCGDGANSCLILSVQGRYCGDGVTTDGEECDNGASNSDSTPNACRTTCTNPHCRDGVIDGGETCDDGNSNNNDLCLNTCLPNTCGDGFPGGAGEQCDLGAGNSVNAACTPSCQDAACGDGNVWVGTEECDDGNAIDTDMCTNSCTIAVCGDGIVGPGETCDDGNSILTDACPDGPSGTCQPAVCGDTFTGPGEQCDDGNANNVDACNNACVINFCGDNVVNNGEQCDDGGTVSGDGCSATCIVEFCGDGIPNNGEQCDDGNSIQTDACKNDCTNNICGDGFQNAGVEQCDDGNSNNDDSCLNSCLNNVCGDGFSGGPGEQCDLGGSNSNTGACTLTCQNAFCGDGHIRAGVEQCDTAGANGNPCTPPYGGSCLYCSASCTTATVQGAYCGDSTINGPEQCDDGSGDGLPDNAFSCGPPAYNPGNSPNTCNFCHATSCVSQTTNGPYCGDNIVQTGNGETCDDGNAVNGDTCQANCRGVCLGTVPNNAQACSGDLTGLTTNQNIALYATSASCTAPKCQYYCNAFHHVSGSHCAVNTCSGAPPSNAAWCSGDGSNVPTHNLGHLLVTSCTSRKCESSCNSGYHRVGTTCQPNVCGNLPAFSTFWPGDNTAGTVPTNGMAVTVTQSDTGTQCEAQCNTYYHEGPTNVCTLNTCSGAPPFNAAWCSGDTTNVPSHNLPELLVSACTSGRKCETFCSTYYHASGQSCAANTCSGSPPFNAAWCAGDTTSVPSHNLPELLVSACTSGRKCESYCSTYYHASGQSCAVNTCSGSPPSNAAWCSGDTSNVPTHGLGETLVSSCTSGRKCESVCNSFYHRSGQSCLVNTCGGKPSNTVWHSGDTTSVPSNNMGATYSASNTGTKCQYYCSSGYTWTGSACVLQATLDLRTASCHCAGGSCSCTPSCIVGFTEFSNSRVNTDNNGGGNAYMTLCGQGTGIQSNMYKLARCSTGSGSCTPSCGSGYTLLGSALNTDDQGGNNVYVALCKLNTYTPPANNNYRIALGRCSGGACWTRPVCPGGYYLHDNSMENTDQNGGGNVFVSVCKQSAAGDWCVANGPNEFSTTIYPTIPDGGSRNHYTSYSDPVCWPTTITCNDGVRSASTPFYPTCTIEVTGF